MSIKSIAYKVLYLFLISTSTLSFAQKLKPFAEFGATVHTGDNTPLWQVSNQHGLSSLDNNTYLRGGAFYKDTIHSWKFEGGVDLAVAAGFTSTFVLQQAYADVRYKWIGLWAGSRELNSPLKNQQLSSGGLTWSGNARPIPQICIGVLDYVHLTLGIQVKAEIAYGLFTDNNYQMEHVGQGNAYTKNIKYHHKSFFFRFGKPTSHWQFDIGMIMDTEFGGYKGYYGTDIEEKDQGNKFKNYINAFIPYNQGENIYYEGNFLGSEHLKLTYKQKDFSIAAYLENYFEDFSAMGKLNGMDGLWGVEYKSSKKQVINGLVLEYLQTTNQSGPLHGIPETIKTGGGDNYYNNGGYPGWTHWGMANGNPLLRSPIYNGNGFLSFMYNRVKAVHLGWSGDISKEWSYRAKFSFNRTWGTAFAPTPEILENFSTFAEFKYLPKKMRGWSFIASAAFDTGDIYGDNLGFQLKVHKTF